MTVVNDIQKTLFGLLCEVDDICQKNHIRYYLHENTALYAWKNNYFLYPFCNLDIAMSVDQFQRFAAVINRSDVEDRVIECWENNAEYAEFNARYVNQSTLFLDLSNYYKYHQYGFGITIHMLRDVPKSRIRSKIYTVLEIGWEMNLPFESKESSKKAKLSKALVFVLMKLMGKRRFARLLWHGMLKIYHNPKADSYITKKFRSRRYTVKKQCLGEPRMVMMEGRLFPVAQDVRYFSTYFGRGWRQKKPIGRKQTAWVIADATVPYQEFFKQADALECGLQQYIENHNAFTAAQQTGQYKIDRIKNYWNLLFRTGDRYELWEMYEPQKPQIMQLYQEKRFDELTILLRPYRQRLNANYKLGLGLCFDPDILQVQLDLFRWEGKDEYAAKVDALIPPEHRKAIVMLDYNGERIHGQHTEHRQKQKKKPTVIIQQDTQQSYLALDTKQYGAAQWISLAMPMISDTDCKVLVLEEDDILFEDNLIESTSQRLQEENLPVSFIRLQDAITTPIDMQFADKVFSVPAKEIANDSLCDYLDQCSLVLILSRYQEGFITAYSKDEVQILDHVSYKVIDGSNPSIIPRTVDDLAGYFQKYLVQHKFIED